MVFLGNSSDHLQSHQYSASQKNWAIPQASFEWIFLLDADERVTELLKNEIKALLNEKLISCHKSFSLHLQKEYFRHLNFRGRHIKESIDGCKGSTEK